jgi:hypothetical protein
VKCLVAVCSGAHSRFVGHDPDTLEREPQGEWARRQNAHGLIRGADELLVAGTCSEIVSATPPVCALAHAPFRASCSRSARCRLTDRRDENRQCAEDQMIALRDRTQGRSPFTRGTASAIHRGDADRLPMRTRREPRALSHPENSPD